MALFFNDFVFKRQLSTQNYKTLSLKGTSHTNFDSEWENENLQIFYKLMSKQKDQINEIGDLGTPKVGGPWQLPKLPYLNPALVSS
jgi:hypothetical protein